MYCSNFQTAAHGPVKHKLGHFGSGIGYEGAGVAVETPAVHNSEWRGIKG